MNKKLVALIVGTLIVGAFIGYLIAPKETTKEQIQATTTKTIWTCSMHPQIQQDKPGKCPICGMDLVPMDNVQKIKDPEKEHYRLTMSTTALALANVETFLVRKGIVPEEDNSKILVGRIILDKEKGTKFLSAHYPGRIEKLFLKVEGQKVHKGQKIAEIYSPELIQAQQELLEAKKLNSTEMINAIKQKLINWKLTPKQIDYILKNEKIITNFPVYAEHSGIIQKINVNVGDYVKVGSTIAELYNTRSLLAEFEVNEENFSQVNIGSKIEFFVSSLPENKFIGTIKYIEPAVNKDNVLLVKTNIHGNVGKLKPGVLLKGYLKTSKKEYQNKILIPRSAVLWTGKKAVVYVKVGSDEVPTFEYREITLGDAYGDYYEVIEGLNEGEEIVAEGEFFIDSAMQLSNRFSMLNKLTLNYKSQPKYQVSQKVKHYVHELLKQYFKLRDALTMSDPIQAQKHINQMLKLLQKQPTFQNLEAEKFYNKQIEILQTSLKKALSNDINKQRQAFMDISNALISIVKAFSIKQDTLYITYCPMFIKDEKAYWISNTKEIKNPYFGERMLKCGVIEDTLK